MFKKILKNLLGEKYYKFRLKYILQKLFGDNFLDKHKKWKLFISNYYILKRKMNRKIAGQSLVKNEKGFLLDFTINNYLSYHLRPKLSKDFTLESTCEISDKFAIIIQGPIKENYNFLLNSLKIYEKTFKNSIIIISTWEDENLELIKKLKKENLYIIFNKKIQKSRSNINSQIISTNSALNFAKSLKVKYCLKTRADIRIYNNNLETFLISILELFPVKKNNVSKFRIIIPSILTYKFFLYHATDLLMFGEIDDLISYWDHETYEKGLEKMGLDEQNFYINQTPLCPETFLCSRFVSKIENNVKWDLDNWWRCLKDYFCVIDNSSLDILWFKYNREVEYRYSKTYSEKSSRSIDFHDWLSLYNNCKNNWHYFSNKHEIFEKLEKFDNKYRAINLFKD
jgi:hypothetical protein